MKKTDTIRQRRVDVYTRSLDQKNRWKKHVKKKGTTLSNFIIDVVEAAIARPEKDDKATVEQLRRKIGELEEEIDRTRKESERSRKLVEIQEKELRRYRTARFTDEEFMGVRRVYESLPRELKCAARPLRSEELLERMGIEEDEAETIRSIYKQLEILQDYGLIKYTPKGWRWTG